MAALPDPRPDGSGHPLADGLRLLRELGAATVPIFAALELRSDGSSRLVVVERALKRAFEDAEIADWMRNAPRLAELDHPNLARVRDVVIRGDEVRVVSDFVDGVRWTELAPATASTASAGTRPPPLETALRVFVDALSGLSALNNLRDAKRQPLKLVHGGLTPDCLIVGSDGVARVIGASRLRSATARLPASGSAYLAPEVLLEDDTADARADVYSIGVMLWEALSGRAFLPHLQPSAIVTQLLSGRLPAVAAPQTIPWAAPLAEVVTRALSADPEKRFASASTMAAELRRIAGSKLSTPPRVASQVKEAFGDAIRARRTELERGEVANEVSLALGAPRKPPEEEFDIDVDDETAEASSTAPTLPPPAAEPEPRALLPTPPPMVPTEREDGPATTPLAIATPLATTSLADAASSTHPPKAGRLIALIGLGALALAALTWWLEVRAPDPSRPPARGAAPVTIAPPRATPPAEREEPREDPPAIPTGDRRCSGARRTRSGSRAEHGVATFSAQWTRSGGRGEHGAAAFVERARPSPPSTHAHASAHDSHDPAHLRARGHLRCERCPVSCSRWRRSSSRARASRPRGLTASFPPRRAPCRGSRPSRAFFAART